MPQRDQAPTEPDLEVDTGSPQDVGEPNDDVVREYDERTPPRAGDDERGAGESHA